MILADSEATDLFSRNYLWLTPEIRTRIDYSKLLIVGCGGNGTLFAVYAAHLGFQQLLICDGDVLEESNLNRHVIATRAQLHRPKTEVLEAYLLSRFPGAIIKSASEFFPNQQVFDALGEVDFVIGCSDNVFTRIELDVLSRKFGKTLIDLGSGFVKQDSPHTTTTVFGAGGQVLVSRPGGSCLRCLGFDLAAESNTYFLPATATAEPSSLLLNSIVASLAVECLISEIADTLAPINRVAYDRAAMSIRTEHLGGRPGCQICGPESKAHIASVAEEHALKQAAAAVGVLPCRTV